MSGYHPTGNELLSRCIGASYPVSQPPLIYLQADSWCAIQPLHHRSYIGIGWEWEKNKQIKDLFEWDSTTMCGLKNNKNPSSIEKKQERMMVYLFGLLLQLTLDPSHN